MTKQQICLTNDEFFSIIGQKFSHLQHEIKQQPNTKLLRASRQQALQVLMNEKMLQGRERITYCKSEKAHKTLFQSSLCIVPKRRIRKTLNLKERHLIFFVNLTDQCVRNQCCRKTRLKHFIHKLDKSIETQRQKGHETKGERNKKG